jgi:hypothetical protein
VLVFLQLITAVALELVEVEFQPQLEVVEFQSEQLELLP